MNRTNIELDEALVKRGLRVTGLKTCKALVAYALRELLRRASQKRLLKLKGSVIWNSNLCEMRRGRKI